MVSIIYTIRIALLWFNALAMIIERAHGECYLNYEVIEWICDDFTSWSDLKQMVNSTNLSSLTTNSSYLNVHPAEPIILTSDFDISQLIEAFDASYQNLTVNIMGLSGIDVALWTNPGNFSLLSIAIENSQIEFFINGTSVNELECIDELIPRLSDH
jgi:hypothetical protein